MEIHEYQAKAILADYGVAIPEGGLAYSPEQATYRASEIGGERWVVKAQVHCGARGQAGGIKICSHEREIWEAADELLGKRLVTLQTGEQGKGVYRLYVEAAVSSERELYLGFVLDRSAERVMVVASAAGGMDIEEIAARDPSSIVRHQDVSELRDKSQEDPRERTATDRGLSYVGLDGNIGCIINGAGLAMATMDMIKHAGGEPANFLDIGGGASPERVLKAFRLVLSDTNVEAVLVNIFAGINRCDWVAEGVVQALQQLDPKVPVVVRLSGTNVEEGRRILAEADVAVITADSLAEAGTRAVESLTASAAR